LFSRTSTPMLLRVRVQLDSCPKTWVKSPVRWTTSRSGFSLTMLRPHGRCGVDRLDPQVRLVLTDPQVQPVTMVRLDRPE